MIYLFIDDRDFCEFQSVFRKCNSNRPSIVKTSSRLSSFNVTPKWINGTGDVATACYIILTVHVSSYRTTKLTNG